VHEQLLLPRRARVVSSAAAVKVSISDADRARAVTRSIERAVAEVVASRPPDESWRVVRFRTQKRLAEIAPTLDGALAVVRVTTANAHKLVAFVAAARGAGVAGVQLVWDGEAPPRERVERHVFAALEAARAAPAEAPVVLCAREAVAPALSWLATSRLRKGPAR
jgi:hypothetical protein